MLFSEEKDVGFECGFTMCFLLIFMILPPILHLNKTQIQRIRIIRTNTQRDSASSETQLGLQLPHSVPVDRRQEWAGKKKGEGKGEGRQLFPEQACAGCHPGQWDGHPSSC